MKRLIFITAAFILLIVSIALAQKEQVQTKDQIHSAIVGQSRAVCEANLAALVEENAKLKQEILKMKEPVTKEEKKK